MTACVAAPPDVSCNAGAPSRQTSARPLPSLCDRMAACHPPASKPHSQLPGNERNHAPAPNSYHKTHSPFSQLTYSMTIAQDFPVCTSPMLPTFSPGWYTFSSNASTSCSFSSWLSGLSMGTLLRNSSTSDACASTALRRKNLGVVGRGEGGGCEGWRVKGSARAGGC